jgi:hypothetical protein
VYDMYQWDRHAPAADDGGGPARKAVAGKAGTTHHSAAQAVQVALDRRDNGGDSSAARDQ